MEIYQAGRQTGKTDHLISWLKFKSNRVLVVHSAKERARIIKEYPDIDPVKIFTIESVLSGRMRGVVGNVVIGVDNLDLILPQILGGSVGPVTMTDENQRRMPNVI